MIWFQCKITFNNHVNIPGDIEHLNIVNGHYFDNIPNTIKYLHIGLRNDVTILNNLPTSLITLNISVIEPTTLSFDKHKFIENIKKNIHVPFGCDMNIVVIPDMHWL